MINTGWSRKHGRLESFLQRVLAAEASRVTWYEPCIVDAGAGSKPTYSFVVLTDGHMYLIDNPPRHVIAIVPLGDILSLQLVHEGPMFLKGADRENTQHIKLTYRFLPRRFKENELRSLSRLSSTPSRSRASTVLSEALSVNSDPGVSEDPDKKQRRLRKFLSSLSWPKKKTAVYHRDTDSVVTDRSSSSWDFADDHSMMSSVTPDACERDRPSSKLSFSRIWPFRKISEGRVMTPDPATYARVIGEPLSPVQRTTSSFLTVENEHPWMTYTRPMSTAPEMFCRPETVAADTSSLANSDVFSGLSVKSEPIPRSRTVLGNYADHKVRAQSGILRSITDLTEEESLGERSKPARSKEELHLYILTPQSSFFKHLKSSWHSCLVKATLEMDDGHNTSLRNGSREYYEQILQDLHRKLYLRSEDNYVQIRLLVDGIQRDVAQSSVAKKLFWKDPDLFPAVVSKLRTVMIAPDSLEDHTIGFTMDKIKACTSLVCMLAGLLQETEVCPGRARHLTYRNGQRTKELLAILVTMPWVPPAYRDITIAAVTSFDHFSSREWETMVEAPLIRSIAELTNVSTMAVHQYFQLAHQGHELISNQKSYGIPWMARVIAEVKSVDTFISRLMCQLLLLTNPSELSPLTPHQSVLLHEQVSVMATLVTHSSALALHVTIMFEEEIRYFVVSHVVGKKVLPDYPIRPSLLSLVDTLRQAILEKKAGVATVPHLFSLHHAL